MILLYILCVSDRTHIVVLFSDKINIFKISGITTVFVIVRTWFVLKKIDFYKQKKNDIKFKGSSIKIPLDLYLYHVDIELNPVQDQASSAEF